MNDEIEIADDQLDSGLRTAFGEDGEPPVGSGRITIGGATAPQIRLLDLGQPDAPPLPIQCAEIDIRSGHAGRLQLLHEVARGGVGVILEAMDPDLGRRVAVKVLRQEHAANQGMILRFIEEAQIGAQLQHPGIVPVYEVGLDGADRPFFSMKLVEGTTLALLLKKRRDKSDDQHRLLRIFAQVCDTIAYAHARGVVHRDLKPGNVMVGAFGEVHVMDWGFAKVRGSVETHVGTVLSIRLESGGDSIAGSVFGTPSYMAPEQARGEPVDARADVFALGAILYEILLGRPPLPRESNTDPDRKRALTAAIDSTKTVGSEPLRAVLQACLAEDPKLRPASAAALATAIANHDEAIERRAHDAELRATAAAATLTAERRGRRRTRLLASIVLIGLIAAGWWFYETAAQVRVLDARMQTGIEDARNSLQRGDITAAHATIMRTAGIAQHAGPPPALQHDIEVLRATIERRMRDQQFEAALIRLRSKPGRDRHLRGAYLSTFADYGVDLTKGAGAIQDALAARTCSILPQVARAFEDLAQRGIRDDVAAGCGALLQVANALDPDPLRRRIRDALGSSDHNALLQLATEPDSTAAAATACLLADSLAAVHEVEMAVRVLERAAAKHWQDLWLHFSLARHYRHHGTEAQARRHLDLAKALHPDPDWDPFGGPSPQDRPPRRRPR